MGLTHETTQDLRKYCDEALGLGIFMISAAFFDALINYPGLPIRSLIDSDLVRRFLVGLFMGATALYIFTSGFGKKSGAYINPAITMIRYTRKDIDLKDAFFYIIFQSVGGILGVGLVVLLFPKWMSDPSVNYVVTVPGPDGIVIAFILEFLISCILVAVVLKMEKDKKYERYIPLAVSVLIMIFITFESPYSGMSMNPARTLASAVFANQWKVFWLYCIAPVLGMYLSSWMVPKRNF